MAEYELKAGAKIELTSTDEMQAMLSPIEKLLRQAIERAPTIIKTSAEITTDGSGNLGGGLSGPGQIIYTCPAGHEAYVHRLKVTAAGYTPTSPLTTGNILVCRNANTAATLEQFFPVAGTVAPVIITEGSHSCMQLGHSETLVVAGTGLPANLNMFLALQIRLWPAAATIRGAG
jgi:hypothetical protein